MNVNGICRSFLRFGVRRNDIRCYASHPKRFYKEVSVVSDASNKKFEINLDHKKLKTPSGKIFQTDSEVLAYAVSAEWLSQKSSVIASQMHLTGLVNTSIDNPIRLDKETLIDSVLSFIHTDTILFFSEEPEALCKLEMIKWQPIIDWFNEKYGLSISPSKSIVSPPVIKPEDFQVLKSHLNSFNLSCIHGLVFGVDALKSIILTLAVLERRIEVKEAVELGRLELLYQTQRWGNVEWAHDIELHDTTSRLAAAAIFVQSNSNFNSVVDKK